MVNMDKTLDISTFRSTLPFSIKHIMNSMKMTRAPQSSKGAFHSAGIIPHYIGSTDEMQHMIDTWNLVGEDKIHGCRPSHPCCLTKSVRGEWCRHIIGIEWNIDPTVNQPLSVILPSWHKDIQTEWDMSYAHSVKRFPNGYLDVKAPLDCFVIQVLQQITEHIAKAKRMLLKDGHKFYYIAVLTSGDSLEKYFAKPKPKKWYCPSIQLITGKVDAIDRPKHQVDDGWHTTAINTAIREFHEETLYRFDKYIYTNDELSNTRNLNILQYCHAKECCTPSSEHPIELASRESSITYVCGCTVHRHMFFFPRSPLGTDKLNLP